MDVQKTLLRVLSCGSVDDGKSTLIGRILHDLGVLYEDQLALLEKERTTDGMPDFSCLLDGLLAEREQAITIDVAYRSFSTANRRYIVADAPGHEQYTRNMVTGASRADVALLLIDVTRAREGLLPQTIRHTVISAMLGIPDIIVALNKMDCCNYSENVFTKISRDYLNTIKDLSFRSVTCIPVSALRGDNICLFSKTMPWYSGPVLIDLLEGIQPLQRNEGQFIMPVQWIARKHGFRGLSGTINSGSVRVGQDVFCLPSGLRSTVKNIIGQEGERDNAVAEDAVCVQLQDDIDVGRGEVLVDGENCLEMADHLAAKVIWLNKPQLIAGRTYICRMGTAEARATVTEIVSLLDLNTMRGKKAKELYPNDVGRVKLVLDRKLPFTPYESNRDMGSFLLIDRIGGNTLGAGMIEHSLQKSHSLFYHNFELNKTAHALQKEQRPCALWFTGLSASGKSTIANLAAKILHSKGYHVYILDGDNLRYGLNQDLGFSESDRAENIRRASEVAKILVDAGLVVLAAFISPYQEDRMAIRDRFGENEFFEIYMDTPIGVCASRDPKGLYARAFAGELPDFTGVSAPFEAPTDPDLLLDGKDTPEHLAEKVVNLYLRRMQ